jgi:hypothetical protein
MQMSGSVWFWNKTKEPDGGLHLYIPARPREMAVRALELAVCDAVQNGPGGDVWHEGKWEEGSGKDSVGVVAFDYFIRKPSGTVDGKIYLLVVDDAGLPLRAVTLQDAKVSSTHQRKQAYNTGTSRSTSGGSACIT